VPEQRLGVLDSCVASDVVTERVPHRMRRQVRLDAGPLSQVDHDAGPSPI
jgi:hypothetical protein